MIRSYSEHDNVYRREAGGDTKVRSEVDELHSAQRSDQAIRTYLYAVVYGYNGLVFYLTLCMTCMCFFFGFPSLAGASSRVVAVWFGLLLSLGGTGGWMPVRITTVGCPRIIHHGAGTKGEGAGIVIDGPT